MGIPERDPNLHVVAQEGRGGRAIDRLQRYTRSAQLGNPPGYSDGFGESLDVPPAWIPEQPVQQGQPFSQQEGGAPNQWQGNSRHERQWQGDQWHEPPRPQRRPGHSDWEVCLRFPFGRLRFGGFIGWESE